MTAGASPRSVCPAPRLRREEPTMVLWIGDRVRTPNGLEGEVIEIDEDGHTALIGMCV